MQPQGQFGGWGEQHLVCGQIKVVNGKLEDKYGMSYISPI